MRNSETRPPVGRTAALLAVVALAVVAAACSSSGSSSSSTSAPVAVGVTGYSVPGSYAAGTARYTMPDGVAVQVWYPVDRSAVAGKKTYTYQIKSWVPTSLSSNALLASLPQSVPTTSYLNAPMASDTAASGDHNHAFPVVLFAHGYGSYPEQSSFLTEHLATWGFVVAAPDEQATDLSSVLTGAPVPGAVSAGTALNATLSFLSTQDKTSGARFDHALDLTKMGVVGHSLGGGAAITLAGNPMIKTYAALAPAPGTAPTTHVPGLVMYGSSDTIVPPSSVQTSYAALPTPKRLIVIKSAGHNVFDDICTIHSGSKSLVGILKGLPASAGGVGMFSTLATDGCFPPDVDPVRAFPLIDQAVTAQMRDGLGLAPSSSGFGPGIGTAFRGVSATYQVTS
jgi:alpha-beta hydrolase superfamily lysophospholipase